MIDKDEIIYIHTILIEKFGGMKGIRDKNALSSSLERPFQTFDAKELYPLAEQKAACLIESILINHPFIDGNKRTGYVVMRLFLVSAGFDIIAAEEEKYSFVISIASGKLKYDEILNWLKQHLTKLES